MSELKPNISYSAGVVFLVVRPDFTIEIPLVLERGGGWQPQKVGQAFREKRIWKLPMGGFKPQRGDSNLIDVAAAEWREETGFQSVREALRSERSFSFQKRSLRPGFQYHEDTFFLVVKGQEPVEECLREEEEIEAVSFFPITTLPTGKEPRSLGAEMSPGHQYKLADLLRECAQYLWESGIDGGKLAEVVEAQIPISAARR